MPKFLNRSHLPQIVYLPSTVVRDERHLIDAGHSITVDDERDVEALGRLCGEGQPFLEVPDDHPAPDYRRSRKVRYNTPDEGTVVVDTSRRK